jgi:hypothetical protein
VTPPARPATVRFYFDADILGLGKTLARLRPDMTYPGDPGDTIHKRARPACPITKTSTLDEDWIPEVARRGWLIMNYRTRRCTLRSVSIAPEGRRWQRDREPRSRLW